jgi:hypothetical protein
MPDTDDDATRIVRPEPNDDATHVVASAPRAAPATAPSGELASGTVVRDRFVIDRVLGRGGMGVVYRAKDLRKEEMRDSDPFVALKVLGVDYSADPRMMMALQREARKAQSLAHPNIATVYDFDRDGAQVYITMEVLDGAPLNEVIEQHPQGLPRPQALSIIRGLCLGLAYAHNKGIVHSDFKPGNIFLTADERTRILDFGIARAAPAGSFSEKAAGAKAATTTQFDAGDLGALTPSYASCEMFEGLDPHPADDVFALAIVAYQLFSGRHPFDFTPAPEARRQGLEPAPIKGLKRREWRALKHGLAFERDNRSGHAAEFLRDMEGSPRLRLAAAVALTLALASAGYAGYDWYATRLAEQPDVDFADLAPDVRSQFEATMADGATFEKFGDAAGALDRYLTAYRLHPRNPQAVGHIESLVATLTERALAGGDARDARVLKDNLDALVATDDFLARRPELVRAMAQLDKVGAPAP